MLKTLETDRFGFTQASDLETVLLAMQHDETMVHIYLPCTHNWVLPVELARERILTKQCPVCTAKMTEHATRI